MNRVLQWIFRAKNEMGAGVKSAQADLNAIGATAPGTNAAAKAAELLAKEQAQAKQALDASAQAGLAFNQIMQGGTGAITGSIALVRALSKELKILATTDVKKLGIGALGPIIGAAVGGFRLGQMLDKQLNISGKVADWIVKPIQLASRSSLEELNKINLSKMDALKKEIGTIGEAFEKAFKRASEAQANAMRVAGAEGGLEEAQAAGIEDKGARERAIAEIQKRRKDEALSLQQSTSGTQLSLAETSKEDIDARIAQIRKEKEAIDKEWKTARQGFRANPDDDAAAARWTNAKRASASFEETVAPEEKALTKKSEDLESRINSLKADLKAIPIEFQINEKTYQNTLAGIAKAEADARLKEQETADAELLAKRKADAIELVQAEMATRKQRVGELDQELGRQQAIQENIKGKNVAEFMAEQKADKERKETFAEEDKRAARNERKLARGTALSREEREFMTGRADRAAVAQKAIDEQVRLHGQKAMEEAKMAELAEAEKQLQAVNAKQAALALAEQKESKGYLVDIEENTRGLGDAINRLLSLK